MAGTTRLELATSAVTGQRSNQLNYVPTRKLNHFAETLAGQELLLVSPMRTSSERATRFNLAKTTPKPSENSRRIYCESSILASNDRECYPQLTESAVSLNPISLDAISLNSWSYRRMRSANRRIQPAPYGNARRRQWRGKVPRKIVPSSECPKGFRLRNRFFRTVRHRLG
jgi:hypothetical protein